MRSTGGKNQKTDPFGEVIFYAVGPVQDDQDFIFWRYPQLLEVQWLIDGDQANEHKDARGNM